MKRLLQLGDVATARPVHVQLRDLDDGVVFVDLVTPATPGHYNFQGSQHGMPGVDYMLQINAV